MGGAAPHAAQVVADNNNQQLTEDDESLAESVMEWIDSMKKKELQRELEGRSLNTKGLKDELRDRLIESMLKDREVEAAASKNNANVKPDVEKVAQKNNDSMDVSMENSAPALQKAKPLRDEEEMQDAIDDHDVDAMEVEDLPDQASMPPPKKQMKTNKELSATWDKGATDKSTGIENHQPIMKFSPNKHAPTNAGNGSEKAEVKTSKEKPVIEASRPASPHRSASPSRPISPLRRMQSTVQSALRNLRPVSPKKINEDSKNSPPKPSKQIVVVPQAFSTDETEASNSSQSDCGISASVAPPVPVLPIPGTARPFTTPAVPSSGASKLGGMSINADSVKAKNNARMARIAEMRNKVRSENILRDPVLVSCRSSLTLYPSPYYRASQ